MNTTIYGFYLIMVMMLPSGDVHGEALDWYFTPYECIEAAQFHHENHETPIGVGFTCIEDILPPEENS